MAPDPYLGYIVETPDGYQVENRDGVVIAGPSDNLDLLKGMAASIGVTLVPSEPSGTVRALREKRRPQ